MCFVPATPPAMMTSDELLDWIVFSFVRWVKRSVPPMVSSKCAAPVASWEPCSGAATCEQRYRAPLGVAVHPAILATGGRLRNSPHRLDNI